MTPLFASTRDVSEGCCSGVLRYSHGSSLLELPDVSQRGSLSGDPSLLVCFVVVPASVLFSGAGFSIGTCLQTVRKCVASFEVKIAESQFHHRIVKLSPSGVMRVSISFKPFMGDNSIFITETRPHVKECERLLAVEIAVISGAFACRKFSKQETSQKNTISA
jgi:hypothetical protein